MAAASGAAADTIELVVHGGTGQVWLHNPNAAAFDFVYYSISSASGALDRSDGVWTSITDTYDASGDGSVDPNYDWAEFYDSLEPPTATTEFAEATFVGPGGTLDVDGLVSLGTVWNPAAGTSDLTAEVLEASASVPVAMPVVYTLYDTDFDFDSDVDRDDLDIWRAHFGTGTLRSQGDADLDGDVDGDDFLLWQQDIAGVINAGAGAGTGAGTLSVASVPEPTAAWLLCAGVGALVAARRLRRRRS